MNKLSPFTVDDQTLRHTREFLSQARAVTGQAVFSVGTFERGITIYGQQLRALNLAFALKLWQEPRHRPIADDSPPSVAVVGGGVFGVTFAAAAHQIGFNVDLFERHQDLLPLQRGCDTRWVHPHSYDWPARGSTTRYARLPLLDWQAATASQVARQICDQLNERVHAAKAARGKAKRRLDIVQNAEVVRLSNRGRRQVLHIESLDGNQTREYDAIVLAVGFGLEEAESTNSYWRNDQLGQAEIDRFVGYRRRYVVTGTGDGGLVDLFRLTITNFDQGQLLSDWLFDDDEDAIVKLREIRSACLETNDLYERLDAFSRDKRYKSKIDKCLTKLANRRRTDTDVILSGRADTLSACLSLRKVSFTNALLAFALYRIGAFRYRAFLEPTSNGIAGSDVQFVFRHGTRREEALKLLPQPAISRLKQRDDVGIPTNERLFPPGWWTTKDARGKYATEKGTQHVEYIAPATLSFAQFFTSALASTIRTQTENTGTPPTFRLTLHRLAHFDESSSFQQIAPYAGSNKTPNKLDGAPGRIFPVTGGIVGLACQTGALAVAQHKSNKLWERLWNEAALPAIAARTIKSGVKSIFACPIFSPKSTATSRDKVSLVIFADSTRKDFFDEHVVRTILKTSQDLINSLERLISNGAVTPVLDDYAGHEVDSPGATRRLRSRLSPLGMSFARPTPVGRFPRLELTKLKAFDIEVNPFHRAS